MTQTPGVGIALALTPESLLSTVGSIHDLAEHCRGLQRDGLLGVTCGDPGQFGFCRVAVPSQAPRPDWILVAPFQIPQPWMPESYRPLVQWIARCHAQGTFVACIGSGVFLLAQAGLLRGPVAVHSAARDSFQANFPGISLSNGCWTLADRVLSSGDLPWQEIVLYVLAQRWGLPAARRAAQYLLLDWNDLIEAPQATGSDPLIDQARHWLSLHYREPHLVSRCAQYTGLPPRSFHRRFKEITGVTPIEYVLQLRISISRGLLLSTQDAIEDIGYAVGYEDIASFRKLFRRYSGVPPGEFRRRQCTA